MESSEQQVQPESQKAKMKSSAILIVVAAIIVFAILLWYLWPRAAAGNGSPYTSGSIATSASYLIGSTCVPKLGYLCSNVNLANGQLSFTFGQTQGFTMENITLYAVPVSSTGANKTAYAASALPHSSVIPQLPSGSVQNVTISGGSSGLQLPSEGPYTTSIWISFRSNNKTTTQQIATLSINS